MVAALAWATKVNCVDILQARILAMKIRPETKDIRQVKKVVYLRTL